MNSFLRKKKMIEASANNQGEALEKLERVLLKTRAERSEILTAILLAEEVTGRMLFDEKQKVFLTVSQFFGDVTLQITHLGGRWIRWRIPSSRRRIHRNCTAAGFLEHIAES